MELSEHARKNRAHWDETADAYQARHRTQLENNRLAWGIWSIPEGEVCALGEVAGKDVLEFGCGAAQWSIGLALAGARCTGVDNSARQLEHARRAQAEAGVHFPLVHASAEAVPLPGASFDIVFCDHGAMSFADPDLTVPEAARLLRPGGRFAFSAHTPVQFICWDDAEQSVRERLHLNYFETRHEDDGEAVVFTRTYGDWVRLFRRNGLTILDLIELRPPEGAVSTYRDYVTYEWARKWPAEQIWVLRKDAAAAGFAP
jgi:SAM-dependent methyltransferase